MPKINMRKKLRMYKFEYDLLQKIPCSKQENKEYLQLLKNGETIPENIYRYKSSNGIPLDEFYTIYEPDLTDEEIQEYLTYKQLEMLKTIKQCIVFFTVLTVVSLLIYFFMFIYGFAR